MEKIPCPVCENKTSLAAMDMTPETAMVKLMWVLGQTDDIESIDSMMQKCFVGELHEV